MIEEIKRSAVVELEVRKYIEVDKQAVQDICYLTGYMGDTAEHFWRHKPSFIEMWTSYYINNEPESLYIATRNQSVVGYLTGCVNSRLKPKLDKLMYSLFVKYGLFFRPGTAGFLWRGVFDTIRVKQVARDDFFDERWPSHLHINLLPIARGTGLGSALMEKWLEQLRQSGSPGCHLSTIVENTRAVSFFEKHGFIKHGETLLIPGMRDLRSEKLHQQIMVRNL